MFTTRLKQNGGGFSPSTASLSDNDMSETVDLMDFHSFSEFSDSSGSADEEDAIRGRKRWKMGPRGSMSRKPHLSQTKIFDFVHRQVPMFYCFGH